MHASFPALLLSRDSPSAGRYAGLLVGVLALAASTAPAQETQPEWERSLAMGFNLTDGNSDTLLGNAALRANREKGEDYFRFSLEGTYGETEDATTTQKGRGQAQVKRRLNGHYVFADVDAQHDDPAGVDYRVIPATGLGRFLLDSEATRLSVELGAGYLWEEVDGRRDDYPVLRAVERLAHTLSETANVWQSVEYVPRAEDPGDYLLMAEAGIVAAIAARTFLRLVVQDRFDSTPGEGLEHNDLSVISSLAWQL